MAVIIGAGTTVGFGGACVISANWNYNPNTQRLYCLGSWSVYDSIEKPTETVSLTVYAPGPSYSIPASQACEDVSDEASLSISPAGCGDNVPAGITGSFAINNYSYSKGDAQAPGQESWGFTRWVGTNAPDHVIRGISEGSATDPVINTGITFLGDTTTGNAGSVSAGAIGTADVTYYGVVSDIGGGTSARGELGNGSASIPLTPLWI